TFFMALAGRTELGLEPPMRAECDKSAPSPRDDDRAGSSAPLSRGCRTSDGERRRPGTETRARALRETLAASPTDRRDETVRRWPWRASQRPALFGARHPDPPGFVPIDLALLNPGVLLRDVHLRAGPQPHRALPLAHVLPHRRFGDVHLRAFLGD